MLVAYKYAKKNMDSYRLNILAIYFQFYIVYTQWVYTLHILSVINTCLKQHVYSEEQYYREK